ncbi:DUF6477 family protein [Aquicoccus sp. G2-2]|uniref:DUF6477 family protein n=1 Tax=Aquicoccus sp. G2-2 TaxID=3092120 RepID=UPI002AE08C30|nr:DUF6477 family protein [Aquicoccus sp. G2-2]MEA1113173.1 DUF6477 family protein [Aquicoccus sp. G2-2]
MTDLLTQLAQTKRPRLLIEAARAGVDDYHRDSHLTRHLGYGALPRAGEALKPLLEKEQLIDAQRREGDNNYSLVTHVDLLIAVMGEARLARALCPG